MKDKTTGASNPPAIVLGSSGASLSITRSLGRAGVPVHVLGTEPTAAVSASRYCTSFRAVGSHDGILERWLEQLEHEPVLDAVLLPVGDDGVELVVRHAERLRKLGYRLLDYAGDTSLAMLDKDRTYDLARAVGVECPRTWKVRCEDDLRAAKDEFPYPCALKPLHSHRAQRHSTEKVLIADDYEDLTDGLARAEVDGVEMLVTEIIPGTDDCNWAFRTYIADNGVPLFAVTTQRLRSRPIHFGTNCYLVTRCDPEVAEIGLQFMQAIGLRGLAYTEFKRDSRDGRLKLIECNHRFGAAQEVVRRAGIDVSLLAYRRALGEPTHRAPAWREGVRLWFPLRDLRAARDYRRRGELTWPSWILSLLRPRVYVPIFALDDVAPTLCNLLSSARRVLRRRFGRPLP